MTTLSQRLGVSILIFMAASFIYAADAKYALHVDHCTVAAEAFDVSVSSADNTPSSQSAGTLLPQLIMEHMSRAMQRDVMDEERMQDKMWPLRQERLELFMKLDNAIRDRDSVVLLPISNGARRRRIKAAKKTIKDAEEALADNLKRCDKAIEEEAKAAAKARAAQKALKDAEEASRSDGIARRLRGKDLKGLRPPLEINIYKDDNTALWDCGVKEAYDASDKHESVKYSAAAVKDGIDILITGKVTEREGYLSASVSVYVYPLAEVVGQTSDVGSSGDIVPLAMRLAQAIIPFVTNTTSSVAIFDISPEDAASKMTLSIDDRVYQGLSSTLMTEGVAISAGKHTLSFSAEGYQPVSATYSFAGGKSHLVQIEMQEVQDEELFMQFTGLDAPSFDKIDHSRASRSVAANAQAQRWLGYDQTQSAIKIDGRPILGVVLVDGAPPAQFYVPLSLVEDNAMLEVKTQVFDRAVYIDKRRRWFYFSYSMLITSLMGAFYTTGRYNAMNGYEDPDTMHKWKTAKTTTSLVSAVCGVWAIYELVRYLRAASKVLPAEAKEGNYDLMRDTWFDGFDTSQAATQPPTPPLQDGAHQPVDNVSNYSETDADDHIKSSEESIQMPQSLDNP